jgi:mono/diheme cytochrome c family protein
MTFGRAAVGRVFLICAIGCFAAEILSLARAPAAHASSRADRELGSAVFHDKGCEHCHGVDGSGSDRGPELSSVGRRLHPMEIERQIHNGGQQMPAFADALTSDEIKQLVAYLQTKKKKAAAYSATN